ncbi:MAG: hypothetical protein D0528_04830 [Methylococcales bacterium]|nr:MAG: hypothetical protein D0528_04830 [Methylococcales bacterium]
MQITINIPDDLPASIVNQQVLEFEEKLKQQSKTNQQPMSKWKKMVQRIENGSFDLSNYTQTFNKDREDFVQSIDFKES